MTILVVTCLTVLKYYLEKNHAAWKGQVLLQEGNMTWLYHRNLLIFQNSHSIIILPSIAQTTLLVAGKSKRVDRQSLPTNHSRPQTRRGPQ